MVIKITGVPAECSALAESIASAYFRFFPVGPYLLFLFYQFEPYCWSLLWSKVEFHRRSNVHSKIYLHLKRGRGPSSGGQR